MEGVYHWSETRIMILTFNNEILEECTKVQEKETRGIYEILGEN